MINFSGLTTLLYCICPQEKGDRPMPGKTAADMFLELLNDGMIVSSPEHMDLSMPNYYQSVPIYQNYGIPDVPVKSGVETGAELEQRLTRVKTQ